VFEEAGGAETDGKRLSPGRIEEAANPIRSFKGRGTDYLLHRLGGEAERLVCASAGNFGQGLAHAARKRNVPLAVFAAENANPAKVERMRQLGAEVRLEGEDFDEAAARALTKTEGWRFVEEALSDLSGVVDDGTIVRAMCLLFWKMGLVVEPAGAAGVAALLAHRERFTRALVATPLCGGNLTGQQVRGWLLEDDSGSEERKDRT